MTPKLSLDVSDLQVSSFQTASISDSPSTGNSWPDVCTCIGICQPSEDIYCSGGCPPETTMPVEAGAAY